MTWFTLYFRKNSMAVVCKNQFKRGNSTGVVLRGESDLAGEERINVQLFTESV